MPIAARRVGVAVLVIVSALVATIVTKISAGSAAPGNGSYVSQTSVTVQLKNGNVKKYSNIVAVSLNRHATRFVVLTRDGKQHTFGKSFESFLQGYGVQPFPTTSPSPTASPSASASSSPTSSSSASPTASSTATTSPSASPTCLGSLCVP